MSSLESKIEYNSSNDEVEVESKKYDKDIDCKNDELQEDDIQCSICNGVYQGKFERTPGIKKKR